MFLHSYEFYYKDELVALSQSVLIILYIFVLKSFSIYYVVKHVLFTFAMKLEQYSKNYHFSVDEWIAQSKIIYRKMQKK